MNLRLLLFFVICNLGAAAQSNYLLKRDDLLARTKNGSDTVYIINFWATWCGPCVKELPHFEKLSEAYKNEKLKVLLVSVDFKSQLNSKVIPFIKKKKFHSGVYILDEKDQQAYIEKIEPSWSGAIPATLFIKGDKRKFSEQEFNYDELSNAYLNFK